MTDLRAALIEAGARALERTPAPDPIEYNRTRIVLDAFLDTLADRADEWWVEAAEGRAVDCRVEHWVHEPEGLIEVLRGDTE